MNKTKIEWADYTVNPVKGLCPMACPYCYARRMYKRYKWPEEITMASTVWLGEQLIQSKPGSRIFWGSTMELFGPWVKDEWLNLMVEAARIFKDRTHIFLTKQPHRLAQIEWPDNCWVGVSTTGNDCRSGLEDIFAPVHAKVKFVSIEPLLDYTPMDFRWVNWVIVGQQTPVSSKTAPRVEWIADIARIADENHCALFLKDNLRQSFFYSQDMNVTEWNFWTRQEMPKVWVDSEGVRA